MNNKKQKVWGFTEELLTKNAVSVHRIEINDGFSCSKHYHKHKHNLFYVEKGHIKVQEWIEEDVIVDHNLQTSETYCVPPNTYHRFTALENSVVYEIYYVELDNNDIIRSI